MNRKVRVLENCPLDIPTIHNYILYITTFGIGSLYSIKIPHKEEIKRLRTCKLESVDLSFSCVLYTVADTYLGL